MIARLRHGLVFGAALGALLLACEIAVHRGPLRGLYEAAGWMPAYVAAGALLGVLAAVLGSVGAPRRARERAHGIQVFATALGLGIIALGWVPHWLAESEGLLLRALLAFGFAVGLHLLGIAAASSTRAWMFASFAAPLTAVFLLLLLSSAAWCTRAWAPHEASAGAPAIGAAELQPPPATNLLIVVLEGIRADRLGCYGSFRATTPYLDALSQEAVLFEQAFATSSEHEPALAGLLGGGELAAALAQRGYQTWAGSGSGAWDESDFTRLLAGFGEREDVREPRLADRLLLARFFAAARGLGLRPARSGDSELVDRALAWLGTRDAARPFGVLLHLGDGGPPYDPPHELRERFRPDDVAPERFEEVRRAQNQDWWRRAATDERTLEQVELRSLSALQDAELLAQDAHLKRLVEGLRAADLLERTLVVITSDHGCRFGEEGGRLGHAGSAHDAVLHVPLLLRLPQMLPAATRARGLVSHADLTPGLLDTLSGSKQSVLARAAAGELPRECIRASAQIGDVEHSVVRTAREKFLLGPGDALVAAGDLLADPDESFLRRAWSGDRRAREQLMERLRVLLALP